MNTMRRRGFAVAFGTTILCLVALGQGTVPAPAYLGAIQSVKPDAAPPGAKITIILSDASPKHRVLIGGQEAKIQSDGGDVLYVIVPQGLDPGDTPPITVITDATQKPANFLGFKITAPEMPIQAYERLRIVGIAPGRAARGEVVRITLSRVPTQRVTIKFGKSTAKNESATGAMLQTRVPEDAPADDETLSIYEGEKFSDTWPFTVLEPEILGIPRSRLLSTVASLFGLMLAGFAAYVVARGRMKLSRLRNQYENVRTLDGRGGTLAAPDGSEAPPEVPADLIAICASGNTVLFAGPGLGAQATLPTRSEALLHLVNVSPLDEVLKSDLRDAVRGGQLGTVTEVLTSRVDRDTLIAELQVLYADDNLDLSQAHRSLQRIPFAGVFTTGWDGLIEKTFEKRQPIVLTGETDVEDTHRNGGFFIARLSGDLYVRESFVFSMQEYRQTLFERPTYAKFVAAQVLSRSLFFTGMSLSGIEEFYEAFRFPVRSSGVKSYALVGFTPLWEAQQDRFRTKYGVELIGYHVQPGHKAVVEFLAALRDSVARQAPVPATIKRQFSDAKLQKITLTNIGPFESLVLDNLQAGWNVLLGNNGTGKSTVLRAIALGLCSDHPEAALSARRLLREGQRTGSIELLVGDLTYKTDLIRDGRDRVLVSGPPITPLQRGNWVALGFPPLRGVSSRDPSGPSSAGAQDPQVSDLLPLIRGSVDTRLDSLKQWLVNLWINGNLPNVSKSDREKSLATIDRFYKLLGRFTPGQPISSGRIESGATWRVYVKTEEDGDIPLENVSQGMSSIFGWVGTLLQRMAEIYPDGEELRDDRRNERRPESALVLVDEIDAHLHPEWQQKLASIVKDSLPGVQMIATTHSPLLVAGMRQNELFISRRNPLQRTRIDIFRSPIDPEGLRADQILTSPLFSLQSSRSPSVDERIDTYVKLLGRQSRSEAEERDFQQLKKELASMLLYGETELDRAAERQAAVSSEQKIATVAAAVADASDEMKERLRNEL